MQLLTMQSLTDDFGTNGREILITSVTYKLPNVLTCLVFIHNQRVIRNVVVIW